MNETLLSEDEQPFRIKTVAEWLGVSEKTVRRSIDHGKIASVKTGGLRVIRRRDFDDFWRKLKPPED